MTKPQQELESSSETPGLAARLSASADVANTESAQADSASLQDESHIVAEYRELYSGPLPPSREARQYEGLLPGSFDRILTMAEQEQTARQQLDLQRHQDTVFVYQTRISRYDDNTTRKG